MSPRTTHLISQNFDCLLMVVILCYLIGIITHTYVIQTKTGPIIHYLIYSITILVVLVMVEAVVVLVLPPSLRKFILVDTGMMWCLGHIIFIAQNPLF